MKKEQLEKVQAEVSVWTYLQSLPPEKNNFKLKILMQEVADTFQIYSYENDDLKRKTTIYYHEETKEYKLLVTTGLTEFCAIEYISESLDKLEVILKERFDNLLGDISHFNREHISSIIEDKAIMDWEYIDNLPKEIDGFKLFINPKDKYQDYRIFFKFSIRNGNCMSFIRDVTTGNELTNENVTKDGFIVDMANSKYLE